MTAMTGIQAAAVWAASAAACQIPEEDIGGIMSGTRVWPRLSPAGLRPAGWLYYNRLRHLTCALYDRAAARPIRPLSGRRRQALAAGREIANTVLCAVRPGARPRCPGTCRQTVSPGQSSGPALERGVALATRRG